MIEPSFGISRILYCILEHNFTIRSASNEAQNQEEEERICLSIPYHLSPITCSVFPLLHSEEFKFFSSQLRDYLQSKAVHCKLDDASQSIGKRYSRADEIGIPFGITVDHESLASISALSTINSNWESFSAFLDSTVTLRDRDSMEQLRVSIRSLPLVLLQLKSNLLSWNDLKIQLLVQKQ